MVNLENDVIFVALYSLALMLSIFELMNHLNAKQGTLLLAIYQL